MATLIIVPDKTLRHILRDRIPGALRAETYSLGLALAEQNYFTEAIVWSAVGAKAEVIETIQRLRRLNRDMRIIVMTPRMSKPGIATMIDYLQVDAYLLEEEIDTVVETAVGVPTIVERKLRPPTSTSGSSAASH
jgi:ActR/RegA family two-component response regulator